MLDESTLRLIDETAAELNLKIEVENLGFKGSHSSGVSSST